MTIKKFEIIIAEEEIGETEVEIGKDYGGILWGVRHCQLSYLTCRKIKKLL